MAEAWPPSLKPIAAGFWLENPSRGGGPSIDGREQTVASMAMRWRASLTVPIRRSEQVLAARPFFAILQGRAVAAAVPVFDGLRAPWPINDAGQVLHPGVTRDKGLDGTPYEDAEVPPASEILAEVVGAFLRGVTEITILITQGGVPSIGRYFSLGERLHLIWGYDDNGNGAYDLRFYPPLRTNVADGQAVNFSRPVCTMKQVADDQGLRALELMRFADLTLEFREDL